MKTTKTDLAGRTPANARHATTLTTTLAAALAASLYATPLAAQPAAAPKTGTATATRAAPAGTTQAGSTADAQGTSAVRGETRSAVTQPAPASADSSTLVERLRALYPSTRFGGIHPTAWPGVYEVAMGANLAYVDATGRYFLFGHLYDMRQQRDLTAERKDAMARIDFGSLPLADALTEVRGKGTRTLAIFSDPDCPYCRRLEAELRGLDDVTIHTFLMPLASLHPAARGKAVSVWCAADRLATWRALMLRDVMPPQADCPHPVDRNVTLGEQLGINGTPTLIAGDGRVMAGAASRDQIETWLSRPGEGAASTATGSGAR
ncbi:DsbC family protein [Roseateles sp.]|uniref:DsbC family protein n=1 Tax=Roseateles sp. TaxID=1971397 RepID=UPI003BA7B1F8